MSIPAMIYLALTFMGIGLALAKDGQPKNDKHSFVGSMVSAVLICGLLYWGGFFEVKA